MDKDTFMKDRTPILLKRSLLAHPPSQMNLDKCNSWPSLRKLLYGANSKWKFSKNPQFQRRVLTSTLITQFLQLQLKQYSKEGTEILPRVTGPRCLLLDGAIPRIFYQYIYLNKTCIMTSPVNMPMRMKEITQRPTTS